MRGNKNTKKLIVALLLGITSTFIISNMFKTMENKLSLQGNVIQDQMKTINKLKKQDSSGKKKKSDKYRYIVAKKDLTKGSKLKLKDLEKKDFEEKMQGSYTSMSNIIGKTLTIDIEQDQLILKKQLIDNNIDNSSIPKGMRLVTIPIASVQGVASYIKIGTRVDVIAISKDKQAEPLLILQNVKIVSLEAKNPNQKNSLITAPESSAITLLVPINSSTKLVKAFTSGKVQLLTRGENDKEIHNLYSDNLPSLKSELPDIPEMPDELPKPATPQVTGDSAKVEIIQANMKSEVNFN